MINIKTITRIIGILLQFETVMLLLCSLVSFHFGENDLTAFLFSAGITEIVSILLLILGKGGSRQLDRRDGYVLVTFAWIAFSLFGMLPFYISGYVPNITNAFFESISGFTSTGATIIDNIEALPHGLLFWRSMTLWIGGLGIIMFTIAILPLFGISGLLVFAAEANGPVHDKIHPRAGVTARWIWCLYTGVTALLFTLLMFGGMNWFDSICHAFSTSGTGGFSTKQTSIAYYHSPYIEYVLCIFMLISGINFTLLLLVINKKFQKLIHDTEFRFYISLIAISTFIITTLLHYNGSSTLEESFRKALFQVISLLTSTGFSTEDYTSWLPITGGILTILMIIGGSAGSTSGGIKCIRMIILAKISRNQFRRILHPNAVLPIRISKQVISSPIQSTVLAFCFLYIAIIIIATLLLVSMGIGFEESIGCAISSLGNIGPGLSDFGPAYSWNALPIAAKWLLSFLMLLGRLELFTVLLLFTPEFWKRI